MTLKIIADMLAGILNIDDVYAGNIDSNLGKCVGVYNTKNQGQYKIALGGKPCTKTFDKKISILIHWTDNPTEAEKKANEILDNITNIRDYAVEDFIVNFFQCNDPVPVGRDERGICEYVIEAKIYYKIIERID